MVSAKTKLKGRELLIGNNSGAVLLLVMGVLAAVFLGSLPAVAELVLRLDDVGGRLAASWKYLPGTVGMALSLLFIFSAILLMSPLWLGREAWFLRGAMGKKQNSPAAKYWFKPGRAFKAAGLFLALRILKACWHTALAAPGAAVVAGALYKLFNGGIEWNVFAVMAIGGLLIMITGLAFSITAVQRYFLGSFIIAWNPEIGIRNALKKSAFLMDGQCFKTAVFKLSFFPWFVLCLLILPVGHVWPYYKQSCACWGVLLMKNKLKHAEAAAGTPDDTPISVEAD